jgi:hypothetical protein
MPDNHEQRIAALDPLKTIRLLLSLIDKGERANLSQSERVALRKDLAGYAADYRASASRRAKMLRRRSRS